jgi:gamma-glutamylcyclotransferase (GGCT)/AIG2-like uncharacterized protein YtfP
MMAGATLVASAETEASFTLFAWGAYPALVHGGTTAVRGEVYDVSPELLAALDAFEGHPTLYRRGEIRLRTGSIVAAYLVDAVRVRTCPVIASGDWRGYLRAR